MFSPDLLAGKRVLVTGGGTGLGRAMALRLAQLGAELFICGRRAEILDQTAQEITGQGSMAATALPCDIRNAEAVAAMMDRIWSTGPLDILINNAAGAMLARTETLSPRAFSAVFSVTLSGTVHCTLEAGRRWVEGGRAGVVLSVTASGVEAGRPFTVPLTVAKAGVLALMRSLAVEWGRHGIRCLAIAPGLFRTEGSAQRLLLGRRAIDPARGVPLGRAGELGELANLAAFLVSDSAAYITGEMITIDGGRALKGQDMDSLFEWTPEQWEAIRPGKR